MSTGMQRTQNDRTRFLGRREFLELSALSSAGLLAGCAVNPVTGQRQLMLMSEADETNIDRQQAPHQYSADYGPVPDLGLNNYISHVGKAMAARSHRASMPYSFRAVNASHVNAYAFPGGSIAVTRGILLSMENEAELAALLGHELGHVNARHSAARMTKSQLSQIVVSGLTAAAGAVDKRYESMAAGLGGIGAGALLARYSRNNERQADELGMEYMVGSGYAPQGMVGLMDILRSMSHGKPSAIELMFSTHPMSDERYQTAVSRAATQYGGAGSLATHRERYMDQTAGVRKSAAAVASIQRGDAAMYQKKWGEAESHYKTAIKSKADDYEALLKLAKCHLQQERPKEALAVGKQAKVAYPQEGQGYHVSGLAAIYAGAYPEARADFTRYDELLPGNPNTVFFKGRASEGMDRKEEAAREYASYLKQVNSGQLAEYAYGRLVEWGYVKPQSGS